MSGDKIHNKKGKKKLALVVKHGFSITDVATGVLAES